MGTRLFPCGCNITEDSTDPKRPVIGVRTCLFHAERVRAEWTALAARVESLQPGPMVTAG